MVEVDAKRPQAERRATVTSCPEVLRGETDQLDPAETPGKCSRTAGKDRGQKDGLLLRAAPMSYGARLISNTPLRARGNGRGLASGKKDRRYYVVEAEGM